MAVVAVGCVQRPLAVAVDGTDEDCRVRINGRQIDNILSNGEELLAAARLTTKRAIIEVNGNTPYKCIGGAVFLLQRAGIRIEDIRVNGVSLPRE